MKKLNVNLKKALKALMFVAAIAVLGLTGCSKKTGQPHHIAVVIGNTMNEANFDLSFLKDYIKQAAMYDGSSVAFIEADGDPFLIDNLTIPPYKKGLSQTKKEQIAEKYTEQLMSLTQNFKAKSAEVDVFKAIQLASRELGQYSENKEILVASSGLGTTGLVNFQKLLLESDRSEELAKHLEKELPDLNGINIFWIGLGDVSGLQTDLYESNRNALRNTWLALLEKSGCKNISFSSALSVKQTNQEDRPYVSTVPISEPASLISEESFEEEPEPAPASSQIVKKQPIVKKNTTKIIKINDEKLSFKPDSPELLNPSKAKKILIPLAKYLRNKKGKGKILLAGTTASCGKEESLRKLSRKRTETVRDLLIALGADKSQIICRGLGFANQLTIQDTNEKNGKFIEERAKKNRAVFVFTNAESESAKELIKKFA